MSRSRLRIVQCRLFWRDRKLFLREESKLVCGESRGRHKGKTKIDQIDVLMIIM